MVFAPAGTEEASERYRGIDGWASAEALRAIVEAQVGAVRSVEAAIPALAAAGEAIAQRLRAGGRMVYAGAGSSGLIAHLDALELPGTYGIGLDRVPVLLAGGREALLDIPNGAEDDADAAVRDVEAAAVGPRDALVAISASGRTPYAVAALRRAAAAGALTVGIASNPATPLLAEADHAVLLATPPEVVAGSTRMNAGTAQKCALNMLSTLIGMRLGHVHDGLMVNVRPENEKLRRRAAFIVARSAKVDEARAEAALAQSGFDVKTAILLAAGAGDPATARTLLAAADGTVRGALARLEDGAGASAR